MSMTGSRRDMGRSALTLSVRITMLGFLLSGLVAETSQALLPSPEHAALEIPLPYQQGNLAYGDEVSTLAIPSVGASIGETIGGQWRVQSWNRRTQTPHYVLGSGAEVAPTIGDEADAETAAHFVLDQLSSSLALETETLRLDTVAHGAGKYAVHYKQTYDGLDVVGGGAHATFLDTGRVFAMGADFYQVEGLAIVPAVPQREAEQIAIDALPHDERAVSTESGEQTGLVVLPYPTSFEAFEPRLAWHVTVVTNQRTGVFHTYIDANTRDILWRYNDVHFADYFGLVDGNVQHTSHCNGELEQIFRYMEVKVNNFGTTTTDIDGVWRLPNADTGRLATTRFFGPYVDVNRASGGSDAAQSRMAFPGTAANFNWSDTNSRQDERDVYGAVVDMHDFFETVDPGYGYSNARITANVGVSGSCNAFWNGTINFYNAGPGCNGDGCANTGEIQGVVHHEYGHGVQNHLIGGQGGEGLGEGNADILANFMTDESRIGRGFCIGNCSGGIRNSDNTLQYPENLTGEVHDDGRIMAGVMWDARERLQSSLGTFPGKARAAFIWHFGRKLERPTNQPDQCLSMFIADDDNGNVFDGTPNFDALCEAVLLHDTDGDAFDCPEAGSVWVDFLHVGTENGSQQNPYNSLFQAQTAAPVGYIMKVRDGETAEFGTLSKRGQIRAIGGVVRIGAP